MPAKTTATGEPLDAATLRELRAIVGAEHVRHADGDVTPYARDATPLFRARPGAVVHPASTEEVAAVLRLAGARGVPVVPRGAGSNLCSATVPLQGGIVLVLTRLDRILEISAEELLAVCQPGVTSAALADAAAAHGLLYAPDPGSRSVATIGGTVATCAGGLRGLKYGVTRNYVLGLEAVLGTGEVIRTGGRLWKDVAGYDLTRLLTGSEGTLGVITEVTLALLPAPETAGNGLAYFPTLADAGRAVTRVIAAGIVPATLEFLDARCVDAVEQHARLGLRRDAGALLIFGDDGEPAAVAQRLDRMAELCRDTGAIEVSVAGHAAESEALLAARRCTLPALSRLGSITILEDVGVPRPRIAEMVGHIEDIAQRHDVTIATFGHAGDGNLHPTCVIDKGDDAAGERAHDAFGEIFRTAMRLGGTITGEHGVGAAKLPYLTERLGAAQIDLQRRIKAAFDPAGILNPGKAGS
ncbi:FAD-binding oxidoreductase [Nonomuraea roseoviolacea]|uniref:Glycolate oxidase n=1 Tax=Nonomuraea roseoviolacea subsp. carminata TaxID=160689 RepID=A0ABT1JR74_9ACTN|nr:FAD-linked oxidase C-terminal domain-containing protein [Nonomuraea roseoviolacea]MCP2344243.1 glycolate oxidase [Nonomuraea roseoviolacea subsp. carminata]